MNFLFNWFFFYHIKINIENLQICKTTIQPQKMPKYKQTNRQTNVLKNNFIKSKQYHLKIIHLNSWQKSYKWQTWKHIDYVFQYMLSLAYSNTINSRLVDASLLWTIHYHRQVFHLPWDCFMMDTKLWSWISECVSCRGSWMYMVSQTSESFKSWLPIWHCSYIYCVVVWTSNYVFSIS